MEPTTPTRAQVLDAWAADWINVHPNGLSADVADTLGTCWAPDSKTSPGFRFLDNARDAAIDLVRFGIDADEYDDLATIERLDDDGLVHEVADNLVPLYDHELWGVFVDLGGYHADLAELVGADTIPVDRPEVLAQAWAFSVARAVLDTMIQDLARRAVGDVDERWTFAR